MPKKVQMSGNEAVANALRQINPDVFPMFPITGPIMLAKVLA